MYKKLYEYMHVEIITYIYRDRCIHLFCVCVSVCASMYVCDLCLCVCMCRVLVYGRATCRVDVQASAVRVSNMRTRLQGC